MGFGGWRWGITQKGIFFVVETEWQATDCTASQQGPRWKPTSQDAQLCALIEPSFSQKV